MRAHVKRPAASLEQLFDDQKRWWKGEPPESTSAPVTAVFDERTGDGWRVKLTFADPPGDWGVTKIEIDATGPDGEWITAENLAALAREFPGLLVVAAQLVNADFAAAAQSGGRSVEGLRAIADIYTQAANAGTRPVKAVMEATGLPRTTANRRVREARELGLLPPTKTMQDKGESND